MEVETFGVSFRDELDFDQWRKVEDGMSKAMKMKMQTTYLAKA